MLVKAAGAWYTSLAPSRNYPQKNEQRSERKHGSRDKPDVDTARLNPFGAVLTLLGTIYLEL